MDVKTIQLLLHHQFSFHQLKKYVSFPFTSLDAFATCLFRKTPELKELLSKVITYEAMCEFYLIYDDLKQQFQKLFTNALIYPMLLYFCSFATIMFLYHFFLPQVRLFTLSPTMMNELIIVLLYVFFWLSLILLAVFPLVHLYASKSQFRYQLYIQALSVISFLQLHRLSCLLFIVGFQYLIKTGVSTKQALEIMLQFRRWPLVHQLAYQTLDLLKQGISLEDSLKQLSRSPLLTQYIVKGEIGNDLSAAFDEYIGLETRLLFDSYRKSFVLLKLLTYVMVVLTLGASYQVISLPLQHIIDQF